MSSSTKLVLMVVLAVVVVFSIPVSGQLSCIPGLTPEHPLEMRTVITPRGIAKTIKVEKEVFLCGTDPQVELDTTRHVNIYTEVIEDLGSIENVLARPPARTFEVRTCDIHVSGNVIGCRVSIPPSTSIDPPCGGLQFQIPPRDPVVLDAVATHSGIVKSVHVEKEIFECPDPSGPGLIKDVNIFTEIIEDLRAFPGKVILRRVEVATCFKDPTRGEVLGCRFESVPVSGP